MMVRHADLSLQLAAGSNNPRRCTMYKMQPPHLNNFGMAEEGDVIIVQVEQGYT